jgi:hypothetical protein
MKYFRKGVKGWPMDGGTVAEFPKELPKDPKGSFGQLNSLAKDLQEGYGDVQRQD